MVPFGGVKRLTDFTTLTFDCYGTLIDWESGILAALRPWRERSGVTMTDNGLLEAYGAIESRQEAATPAAPYPAILGATLGELSSSLGHPASRDEADAFAASVGDWPAFPDSRAALQYLKRHFKLVILSNVDRASFARSNARLGVAFDAIVTAEDVGSYKPDARNFQHLLRTLADRGIAEEQVLHTAQSKFHDIGPARAIGLATNWIDRRAGKAGGGATPPAADATPDFTHTSLADFVTAHQAASSNSEGVSF
ncbi:MAG: haloacid dehalogenase type II [Alphaproteobacteria bacterium]|nr:haloacid dehalogenase type II [Alphaproteobacteria bacterium]